MGSMYWKHWLDMGLIRLLYFFPDRPWGGRFFERRWRSSVGRATDL